MNLCETAKSHSPAPSAFWPLFLIIRRIIIETTIICITILLLIIITTTTAVVVIDTANAQRHLLSISPQGAAPSSSSSPSSPCRLNYLPNQVYHTVPWFCISLVVVCVSFFVVVLLVLLMNPILSHPSCVHMACLSSKHAPQAVVAKRHCPCWRIAHLSRLGVLGGGLALTPLTKPYMILYNPYTTPT